MSKKYPGYREDDTSSDEYFKERGLMNNREFFTSNSEGGFYEGMEWDNENEEWIPNAKNRAKQKNLDSERCFMCDCKNCICNDY